MEPERRGSIVQFGVEKATGIGGLGLRELKYGEPLITGGLD